jgi:ABC-2 type transport system ATP-binding protein
MSIQSDQLEESNIRSAGTAGASAFKAEALSKSYGHRRVLDGLNLVLEPGETVGLLGSNGSGKTTLLKTLLGLLLADGGRSSIGGEPSQALSPAIRARVGYVPQTPNQFIWLNGRSMLRYLGAFYPSFDWTYTNELVERWKVSLKTPIGLLSPGQQQRLSIVRALAPRPDFMVLDEPIAALDPATRMAVIDELLNERRARGISIIFSSHITGDLERLCSRFVVLAGGKIALDESTESCRNLVRISVIGAEELLNTVDWTDYRHIRKPRDNERAVVTNRNQAADLLARLPKDLTATLDDNDLESALSEWMQ